MAALHRLLLRMQVLLKALACNRRGLSCSGALRRGGVHYVDAMQDVTPTTRPTGLNAANIRLNRCDGRQRPKWIRVRVG